jgi:hypothetical protein
VSEVPVGKDYKCMVIRQKQAALDTVPLFILIGGVAGGAVLSGFAGIGIYAYLQAWGGYNLSELLFQATSIAGVIGGIFGVISVFFASMFKDQLRKDYEKEFDIKLS